MQNLQADGIIIKNTFEWKLKIFNIINSPISNSESVNVLNEYLFFTGKLKKMLWTNKTFVIAQIEKKSWEKSPKTEV